MCARHTQSYMCMYKARKYFTVINTVSMEIYANIVFMRIGNFGQSAQN